MVGVGGLTLSALLSYEVVFDVVTSSVGMIDGHVNTYGLNEWASSDESECMIAVPVASSGESV